MCSFIFLKLYIPTAVTDPKAINSATQFIVELYLYLNSGPSPTLNRSLPPYWIKLLPLASLINS